MSGVKTKGHLYGATNAFTFGAVCMYTALPSCGRAEFYTLIWYILEFTDSAVDIVHCSHEYEVHDHLCIYLTC
jgi:hypothetical protein